MYVLRIWGHCQTRRATEFEIPPAALKAICRAGHDAITFEQAMTDAGFVLRNGPILSVPKWAEHNAKLIANWGNGASGGRPKKNPPETHAEPTGNPPETHTEPIREEKRREEKTPPCASADAPRSATTSEGFERFWAAYPRKRSKGDAEKAWAKLKPDAALLGRILQAVEVAKARDDWRKEGGQYVPYPATWLSAKGWLDDPSTGGGKPDDQWWLGRGFGTRESAIAAGAREPA